MRKVLFSAALLAVATATQASAQLFNTGINPTVTTVNTGGVDVNWSVASTAHCAFTAFPAPAPVGGGTNGDGQCGTNDSPAGSKAFIVDDITPYWQPQNDAAVNGPRWISAWVNSSGTCTPSVPYPTNVCDAANPFDEHFDYDYKSTIGSTVAGTKTGHVQFTLGWDNLLTQFCVNGSCSAATNYLVGSSVLGNAINTEAGYGFCRDGDGLFPGSGNTGSASTSTCVATFDLTGLNFGNNTFEIKTLGDGTTDGLYLAAKNGGIITQTTPEPATMTLLGLGLVGLTGSSFRRRKAQK